jgi:hypothetical protein
MNQRKFLKQLKKLEHDKQSENRECKAGQGPTHREIFVESTVRVDLSENLEKKYKTYDGDDRAYKKKQLFWSRFSTVLLAVYAAVTLAIYHENKKSAEAAKSAADTSANQLELSERPWIRVDLQLNGPLTFDKNGLNTSSTITMTNIGNSVATHMSGNSELILQPFGPETGFLRAKQDALCKSLENMNERYGGDSLFPRGVTSRYPQVAIPRGELEEAGKAAAKYGATQRITPIIIGCAVYKSTFGDTTYFTAMALFVLGKGENGVGTPISIKDTAIIPMNEVFTGIPPYESVRVK